jgi:hypothetical protein
MTRPCVRPLLHTTAPPPTRLSAYTLACLPACSFKACVGEEGNLLVMPCWQKDDPSDTMVRPHPLLCPTIPLLRLACCLLRS